jgi:hypothetical protein
MTTNKGFDAAFGAGDLRFRRFAQGIVTSLISLGTAQALTLTRSLVRDRRKSRERTGTEAGATGARVKSKLKNT